ncbi:MAG: DUF3795 domain-containing protein [bacterium]
MESKRIMAVCGIICNECDIFKATENPEIAERIQEWFKKKEKEVRIEEICCLGCRGDRTRYWSSDCPILKCCVDEGGLNYYYECDDFVCERLDEWAKGGERYRNALNRLRDMRNKKV